MESNSTPWFGSEEHTAKLHEFFVSEATLLRRLASSKLSGRAGELMPVLMGTSYTCLAMSLMAPHPLLNECFMLSRAFLERVINCCYLMVCDEDELRRFQLHTIQKAYRKLDREVTAGEESFAVRFTGEIDKKSIPQLQEALDTFTSRSGREITHWSPTTLSDRIRVIGERSKVNIKVLLIATLAIYEDASEALHGTFYGSTFHLGVFEPGARISSDETSLKRRSREGFSMLYWLGGLMLSELIKLVGEQNGLSEIVSVSKENLEKIKVYLDALEGRQD